MKILASKRLYEGMAGAWLIVQRGDKFLAARRAPYCKEDVGKWNWIGGGVDDTDDSPKHAAIREFEEECGVNFYDYWDQIDSLLSVFNHVTGGTCHFFLLQLPADIELDLKLNQEHDKMGWFTLIGDTGALLPHMDSLNWPTAASLVPLYLQLKA